MPKVRSSRTHIRGLGDLTPDPQNANLGTERGRKALAQSLREFGPGRAVVIDRDGNIIAGNKTVEEAKRLNIPLQVLDSLIAISLVQGQRFHGDSSKRRRNLAVVQMA